MNLLETVIASNAGWMEDQEGNIHKMRQLFTTIKPNIEEGLTYFGETDFIQHHRLVGYFMALHDVRKYGMPEDVEALMEELGL